MMGPLRAQGVGVGVGGVVVGINQTLQTDAQK